MKRKKTLAQGLQEVRDDGQGAYTIEVVTRADTVPLFMSAAAGNKRSQGIVSMVNGTIERILNTKPTMLCLLCPHEFDGSALPEAFVILTGMRDDLSVGVANGLCAACFGGPDMMKRIADYYRQSVIPDLRVIEPVAASGRA